MMRAVQVTTDAGSWDEAYSILRALAVQTDFLGGRVYGWGSRWRVQAFHEAGEAGCWLPDGCRHVVIPGGLAASLGLVGQ